MVMEAEAAAPVDARTERYREGQDMAAEEHLAAVTNDPVPRHRVASHAGQRCVTALIVPARETSAAVEAGQRADYDLGAHA
jgi:hypothetical protein